MKTVAALSLSLFFFILGAAPAGAAPSLVYSTWLGGAGLDVAVDSAGNAIVLGRSSSGYFLAKLNPLGELIFLRTLELPSMSLRVPTAVALDPAGYIYIAGTANLYDCDEPWECGEDDNNEVFVAKLGPDGTGLFYDTIFSDPPQGVNTQAHDLAVDALGHAHVHFTSHWTRYGAEESYGVSFSPAGSLQGFFGYAAYGWSYVNAMALGPSGDLFTVGWWYSEDYPDSNVAYLQRTAASSGAVVVQTVFDYSGTLEPLDVAATPGDGSVVVGTKSEGLYVAELGPAGEEVFSRVLNLGAVEISDVAVTSSGQIVLAVGTSVLWLEGGTGEVLSSMNLGGPVSAVAVGPGGNVYAISGGFVSRFSENRPPDCSGATASPSVIWPANGKMIPVSILGVTDPESDPVAMKVTGISQDEPGAAFSGIGSSVAQVKAERDGKGDGRVYRILFEATDPSGASCAGEVTVCVPHDRGKGKGSCADGAR